MHTADQKVYNRSWLENQRRKDNPKYTSTDGILTFNVLAFKRPQPPAGRSFSGI